MINFHKNMHSALFSNLNLDFMSEFSSVMALPRLYKQETFSKYDLLLQRLRRKAHTIKRPATTIMI